MFAQYALPAAMVAGALGAIVLCVVLLLYGFGSVADDEPRFASRRLFVIRIGHALAASCFAVVVILTSVAFFGERRRADVSSSAEVETLDARMSALEQRLTAPATRSSDGREEPATVELPSRPIAPAVTTPSAPRAVIPRRASADRSQRVSPDGQASIASLPPRGAGESPVNSAAFAAPPPPSPEPSSSLDVRAKVRSDWQIIKRGFRDAGRDIGSSLSELPSRVKRTFASDSR
jgi:hypothetical protein